MCQASDLAAKVTEWEGAAGHQIASVTVTNGSSGTCTSQGTPEVELVDAHGGILIDSQTDGPDGLPHVAPGAPVLTLRKGASVTTLVDADNYCGADPALPTTVAFVLPVDAGPTRRRARTGRRRPALPSLARVARLHRDERLGQAGLTPRGLSPWSGSRR